MNRTKYISTARSSTESSSGQTSSISFKKHWLWTLSRNKIYSPLSIYMWLTSRRFTEWSPLCNVTVWASGQPCALHCMSNRTVMCPVLCEHQGSHVPCMCEHQGSCVLCIMWTSWQPCAVHCVSIRAAIVLCTVWASGKPCTVHCMSIRATACHELCENQGSCVPCTVWASEQLCAIYVMHRICIKAAEVQTMVCC